MLDTDAELNLINARSLHLDMQILRENKLHIVGVTDDFVESLRSVQVILMAHPLKMDVVFDNFPIFQEGILGTDFLKDSAPTDIRYDVQRFLKYHVDDNIIYTSSLAEHNSINLPNDYVQILN